MADRHSEERIPERPNPETSTSDDRCYADLETFR
jgi:hypothetical protein